MSVTRRRIIFWSEIFLIVFIGLTGFLLSSIRPGYNNLGLQTVKTMYEFKDLEDLNSRYGRLETIVDRSLWDSFSLNNDSRVLGAYYKFNNSSSRVEVIMDTGRTIIYKLVNDYINPEQLFVFDYEVSAGKIVAIREYELKGVCWGTKGVWQK